MAGSKLSEKSSPCSSDNGFVLIDKTKSNIQNLICWSTYELSDFMKEAQREFDDLLRTKELATNLGSENKQVKCENVKLQSRIEELEKEKSEMKSKCQEELYKLQQKINKREKEIDGMTETEIEDNRMDAKFSKRGVNDDVVKWKIESYDTIALQLKETQDKLRKTEVGLMQAQGKLRETEVELDSTKSRLSKSMGDKLTDDNPNIADLSDKNRPTKLAEKFQELYDNQWTDAFENVELKCKPKEGGKAEERTTSILIKILMETKKFCEEEARIQTKTMQGAITAQKPSSGRDIHISKTINKQIKDCRRNVAVFSGEHIFQKYREELDHSNSSTALMAKSVPNFVKECFNICWLMTVQDPPLAFGPDITKGERFNTDMYKAYTKSGRKIDFVVWPALLLHQNGPVLTKGIAQGLVEDRR